MAKTTNQLLQNIRDKIEETNQKEAFLNEKQKFLEEKLDAATQERDLQALYAIGDQLTEVAKQLQKIPEKLTDLQVEEQILERLKANEEGNESDESDEGLNERETTNAFVKALNQFYGVGFVNKTFKAFENIRSSITGALEDKIKTPFKSFGESIGQVFDNMMNILKFSALFTVLNSFIKWVDGGGIDRVRELLGDRGILAIGLGVLVAGLIGFGNTLKLIVGTVKMAGAGLAGLYKMFKPTDVKFDSRANRYRDRESGRFVNREEGRNRANRFNRMRESVQNSKFGKFAGKAGKFAGKAAAPIAALAGIFQIGSILTDKDLSKDEKTVGVSRVGGTVAGGLAGAKGGALAGAAIGSIVPGVGTAIGGFVGSVVGGIGGALVGGGLGEKIGEKIVDSREFFGKMKDSIGGGIATATEYVGEKFSDLKDSTKIFLTNLSTTTNENFESAKTWASEKYNFVKSEAMDKWEGFSKFANNTFESAKTWASEKYNFIKNEELNTWEGFSKFANNTFESAKTWASEKYNFVKSEAMDKWEGVSGFAKDSFETVSNLFNSNLTEEQKNESIEKLRATLLKPVDWLIELWDKVIGALPSMQDVLDSVYDSLPDWLSGTSAVKSLFGKVEVSEKNLRENVENKNNIENEIVALREKQESGTLTVSEAARLTEANEELEIAKRNIATIEEKSSNAITEEGIQAEILRDEIVEKQKEVEKLKSSEQTIQQKIQEEKSKIKKSQAGEDVYSFGLMNQGRGSDAGEEEEQRGVKESQERIEKLQSELSQIQNNLESSTDEIAVRETVAENYEKIANEKLQNTGLITDDGLKRVAELERQSRNQPYANVPGNFEGKLIAGEVFVPGQPLSKMQRAAIKTGISMGNTYSKEVMDAYNKIEKINDNQAELVRENDSVMLNDSMVITEGASQKREVLAAEIANATGSTVGSQLAAINNIINNTSNSVHQSTINFRTNTPEMVPQNLN